jgi:hypothetical protein
VKNLLGLTFSANSFARMLERKRKEQEAAKKGAAGDGEHTNGVYIDTASTLFAQHYSIIRELLGYCGKFKEELAARNDLEEVWRNLDLLMSILEAGCHFLRFPIVSQQ